jgi:hypothetical protein
MMLKFSSPRRLTWVSGASGSEAEVYGKDGSSIGLGTALTAVVGMHF